MSAIALLRKLRLNAQARNELDRLSAHQLRDLNLERVTVLPGTAIYQHRNWNGI
jgi:uncharacterized protein YjiS (DUF1127 family)